MYIHLGRDYVLNDRDIIGIFDLETTTTSPRGREFLNYAQKNGAVVSLSDELPQCYVLADGAGGCGVSFGAVQRRHAPQSAKDGGVKFAENGRKIHRKKRDGKAPELPRKPHRASRNARCGQRVKTQQNGEKKVHHGVPVPALL